jgi:hypothetical protein
VMPATGGGDITPPGEMSGGRDGRRGESVVGRLAPHIARHRAGEYPGDRVVVGSLEQFGAVAVHRSLRLCGVEARSRGRRASHQQFRCWKVRKR